MVIRTGGTRVQGLGEPPGDVGGTAGPIYLKAFLIRESKNPFRQAWLGNVGPIYGLVIAQNPTEFL